MRLTERQARIKLAAAVDAVGGQTEFARRLGHPSSRGAQSMVSRAVLGRRPISAPILAVLGLRRDECGDIHTVEPPARIEFLADRAEGDAGDERGRARRRHPRFQSLNPQPPAPGEWRRIRHEPKLRKPEARAVVRGACKAVSTSELGRPVEPVGSHLRELAHAIDGMDQEDGDGR
ncbi:hypothetical protein PQI07_16250 [Methylobacterium sp. 092160098-2]|uniref:hypothetical protein n=1 Tax=Methylobacterium sp. 092160098-2 TaxID=3025129 RepID=UPI002381C6F1|nr:hypothetical protein [Methylobacterium sp. 092160098-2]MDE4912233.1 hypothetical protein [Methylobacterium sp. 092160098-2]